MFQRVREPETGSVGRTGLTLTPPSPSLPLRPRPERQRLTDVFAAQAEAVDLVHRSFVCVPRREATRNNSLAPHAATHTMSRHARAASAPKNALLLAHCAVSVAALVMKPTPAVRQPLRRITRRTQPQMMAFLPISSIPMIGKARRTTKLSVAIDPFTEVENLPLQLLAKASAALVAVQLLATLDFPALIGSYNAALASRPFTTKAAGTGITYFFSDLTAQALEGDRSSLIEKVKRATQFALVGALWVGPLLAAWFQVMDFYVPGRSAAAVSTKIVLDQVLQGPFMISTMFLWTGLLAGAGLSGALASIRGCLRDTWVKSVYVWSPVQAVQQLFVPPEYRVAVANGVSYFWDTYLAMEMSPSAHAEHDDSPAELAFSR